MESAPLPRGGRGPRVPVLALVRVPGLLGPFPSPLGQPPGGDSRPERLCLSALPWLLREVSPVPPATLAGLVPSSPASHIPSRSFRAPDPKVQFGIHLPDLRVPPLLLSVEQFFVFCFFFPHLT